MSGLRILALLTLSVATACTVSGPEVSTSSSTTSPAPGASDGIPVEEAVAEVSALLGVAPEDVAVAAAEAVMWNDGALGCPRPGLSYTQALVPGYRIVLTVGGAEYAYHGRDGGAPFLCDRTASGEVRSPDR